MENDSFNPKKYFEFDDQIDFELNDEINYAPSLDDYSIYQKMVDKEFMKESLLKNFQVKSTNKNVLNEYVSNENFEILGKKRKNKKNLLIIPNEKM